ncbi:MULTISPECIES: SDR family oxidoreductase [unclassified Streptomyces]|uniref:SDR family oxidoreductase n=1 Tax=unclassified Streptomyces TaxID=2593676 RepID=UPI00037D2D1A|nr:MULTISPECIES: SDR family oxidoreductase [unclassified Streptomyces]MYT29596.1 NAD-dependent epimerase/dehydratase family protein [Streptomyces sp. SID8354]
MWQTEVGGRPLNVLLTGATGVVGSALLPHLGTHHVTCLLHETALNAPRVKTVRGDIRLPYLGLSHSEFKEACAVIDVIVHAAANTSFGAGPALAETNVAGTQRIIELAREAKARLVYVSTAFSALGADGGSSAPAYARTKAQAEELVGASGLPAVVVRPSIIVGDSHTGQIARHQGFHKVCGAVLGGHLPLIPLDPTRLVDFVPQDVVARHIADLIEEESDRTELWLTAGSRALHISEVVSEIQAAAEELGRPVPNTRFVDEDLYERLIVPVFLTSMPEDTRRLIQALAEQLTPYVSVRNPFPSDVAELPDQRETLRASLLRWAKASGFHARDASGAVR